MDEGSFQGVLVAYGNGDSASPADGENIFRKYAFGKYAFGKYCFHYMITTKTMMFEKNVLDDHLTTFAVIEHVGICVRNL